LGVAVSDVVGYCYSARLSDAELFISVLLPLWIASKVSLRLAANCSSLKDDYTIVLLLLLFLGVEAKGNIFRAL